MNTRTVAASAVGAGLLALGIIIHKFGNQQGVQLLLLVPTFLAVGIVAGSFRRGALLSILLTALLAVADTAVNSPGSLREMAREPSRAAATVVLLIIPSVVFGAIGGLGGFIGGRVARRSRKASPEAVPPAG